MRKDYLITHKEIAEIGYYFLEHEQEKKFLESINNELVERVATDVCGKLPPEQQIEIAGLVQDELYARLKDIAPGFDETINKNRSNILREIKMNRKDILIKGAGDYRPNKTDSGKVEYWISVREI